MRLIILFFTLFFLPAALTAQPFRTLIVYSATSAESADVASYYALRRGIPAQNLCAITPPTAVMLTEAEFVATVKVPVRNCLNAVGSANILYIVFSYLTPYKIATEKGPFSLDQTVADIWDEYKDTSWFHPWPTLAHPYYAAAQSQGNAYLSFVSLADYRGQAGAKTIYSVWRLDAPNAALAKGLVDKAIQAETY